MSENITLMKKRAIGKIESVTRAPSRYVLKAFGGTMTIEDFRSVSKDNYPILQMPDEIHGLQEVAKKGIGAQSVSNTGKLKEKLNEINQTSSTNEPLRLKRSKPLKREQNSLEISLGLIKGKK